MSKEQLVERLKENPLDRERWIEVGKAMGWQTLMIAEQARKPHHEEWHYHWHRFIDHLAEGKDAESFFQDLLTKE